MTAKRGFGRRQLLALALAASFSGMAGAAETQGFRFQIVTGDDSSVTRREFNNGLGGHPKPAMCGHFKTGHRKLA